MRSVILILILIFLYSVFPSYSQLSKIDSLSRLLAKEKTDSNQVTLLWRLAEQYQSIKPESSLLLAQKALLQARRIHYTEGESRSLAVIATSQYLLGNYPTALNNYMLKLKLEEKRNSPRNYVSALSNIGLMYILLGQYQDALSYLYRADSIVEVTGGEARKELKYNIVVNIGETYYRMEQLDSSTLYFKKALAIARQTNDHFSLGASMLGLANILSLRNENEASLHYYYEALNYLSETSNEEMLCEVTLGIARVYDKTNREDSAGFYANRSFNTAEKGGFLLRQRDAANFLSQHFKKTQNYANAFLFLEQSAALDDSIMGQEKTREAMIISNNEKVRQVELAEQKLRDKETRSNQLQLLIIAIFIPALFLLTLFVSRIKIHQRVVKFLGVISLLFLFEFLTLLMHPMVAEFAHHLFIVELLTFVCLAAIIIPVHHRLEHLLLEKLTKQKHIIPDMDDDISPDNIPTLAAVPDATAESKPQTPKE